MASLSKAPEVTRRATIRNGGAASRHGGVGHSRSAPSTAGNAAPRVTDSENEIRDAVIAAVPVRYRGVARHVHDTHGGRNQLVADLIRDRCRWPTGPYSITAREVNRLDPIPHEVRGAARHGLAGVGHGVVRHIERVPSTVGKLRKGVCEPNPPYRPRDGGDDTRRCDLADRTVQAIRNVDVPGVVGYDAGGCAEPRIRPNAVGAPCHVYAPPSERRHDTGGRDFADNLIILVRYVDVPGAVSCDTGGAVEPRGAPRAVSGTALLRLPRERRHDAVECDLADRAV